MDFSTHPFALCVTDKKCELYMFLPGFKMAVGNQYENLGKLLSAFLNHDYETIISAEILKRARVGETSPDGTMPWISFVDCWDRDQIEELVNDIYFNEDEAVNSLKPRQRFRIYMIFKKDMFAYEYADAPFNPVCKNDILTCERAEQPFSDNDPIINAANAEGKPFIEVTDNVIAEKRMPRRKAMFIAGCNLAEAQNVYMPRQEQYWFKDSQNLVIWLLRYVIEHDKFIKKCEWCNKFFIPERNTKKFCSETCANAKRKDDSFCGVTEARTLYIRIIANYHKKEKLMIEKNYSYHTLDNSARNINITKVRTTFCSENMVHCYKMREAYEAFKNNEAPKELFEEIKSAYVEWLKNQEAYAKSIRVDYDAK